MNKKLSDSRRDFSKKMTKVDSRNEKINDKLNMLQERFDSEAKAHKQNLDH